MKNSTKALVFVLLGQMMMSACSTESQPDPISQWEFQPTADSHPLKDFEEWDSLVGSLKAHIHYLSSRDFEIRVGSNIRMNSGDLSMAFEWLLQRADQSDQPQSKFFSDLQSYFYRVSPRDSHGSIAQLVTGYYQPSYHARHKPTTKYRQPLFQRPPELLQLSLLNFQNIYSGEHQKIFPSGVRIRGHVVEAEFVPFHSRREIDTLGILRQRGLEIAYLDPVDAFFLHIQGSGRLEFSDGSSVWVGFADQNGHPYLAVGKRLLDHVSSDEMGMGVLRQHMESLRPHELQKFLNQNPSYVFFEERADQSHGALGLPPQAGRTVAVDPGVFPLGGVGFMEFIAHAGELGSRLVLFQDTGGAIKGPKVDLFMGQGKRAGEVAGELKARAHVSVWIPKPELMRQLAEDPPF